MYRYIIIAITARFLKLIFYLPKGLEMAKELLERFIFN